jgi:hypothetical protein
MQLSKVLSLAFAAVAMAAVNGTNPRTANSTNAKAPVGGFYFLPPSLTYNILTFDIAKQMSPAEIMAKIDALDADS